LNKPVNVALEEKLPSIFMEQHDKEPEYQNGTLVNERRIYTKFLKSLTIF